MVTAQLQSIAMLYEDPGCLTHAPVVSNDWHIIRLGDACFSDQFVDRQLRL